MGSVTVFAVRLPSIMTTCNANARVLWLLHGTMWLFKWLSSLQAHLHGHLYFACVL